MKSVSISGSIRKNVGKKDANLLRSQGKIPCVLYGGKEQYHFTVDEIALEKIITTFEVYLIKLQIEGKEINSIIQEIQLHPVTDKVIHADFLELLPGKLINIKVPVICTGTPEGVLKGGVLLKKIKRIKIRSLADSLPDNVTLAIDKLDIGDSIRVSDIPTDNFQIMEIPSALVVGVRTARAVVEEVPAEGAVPVEGAPAEGAVPAEGAAAEGKKEGEKGKGKEAEKPAKGKKE